MFKTGAADGPYIHGWNPTHWWILNTIISSKWWCVGLPCLLNCHVKRKMNLLTNVVTVYKQRPFCLAQLGVLLDSSPLQCVTGSDPPLPPGWRPILPSVKMHVLSSWEREREREVNDFYSVLTQTYVPQQLFCKTKQKKNRIFTVTIKRRI